MMRVELVILVGLRRLWGMEAKMTDLIELSFGHDVVVRSF